MRGVAPVSPLIGIADFGVEVEEHGFCLEPYANLILDTSEAAGDVTFRMAEYQTDFVEVPAAVLSQGEHGEVTPLSFVLMRKVLLDEVPEEIGSLSREDDFDLVTVTSAH